MTFVFFSLLCFYETKYWLVSLVLQFIWKSDALHIHEEQGVKAKLGKI